MKRCSGLSWRIVLCTGVLTAALAGAPGCGKEEKEPGAPQATARARQSSTEPREITTETGIAMVLIPAGEFVMGDESGEDDERPAHRVHVDAFYMDKYEVTQEAYEGLMGKNPAKHKGPKNPVEQVSWAAAARYCNMRSLREGLTPCYDPQTFECNFDADGYRLPTEAEWEYACRAGTTSAYSFGDSAAALKNYAWYDANSGNTTHPVGRKKPNPWGLYDMHGNVFEWCNDYYAPDYYTRSPEANPRGPDSGDERVLRGGSWANSDASCRCSARYSESPGLADVCFGYDAYGFRCVRRAPPAPARAQTPGDATAGGR